MTSSPPVVAELRYYGHEVRAGKAVEGLHIVDNKETCSAMRRRSSGNANCGFMQELIVRVQHHLKVIIGSQRRSPRMFKVLLLRNEGSVKRWSCMRWHKQSACRQVYDLSLG